MFTVKGARVSKRVSVIPGASTPERRINPVNCSLFSIVAITRRRLA
jgi:hypothetical protein